MEEWRVVKEFPKYEVSNHGRIRNISSGYISSGNLEKVNRIGICGYMKFTFYIDGNRSNAQTVRIHRLVAETFVPNPHNKPHVNHIDGNKSNNRVDNLEWSTRSENMKHAIENNLLIVKGERVNVSKLKNIDIPVIRDRLKNGETVASIARSYGVTSTAISGIKNGHAWKNA